MPSILLILFAKKKAMPNARAMGLLETDEGLCGNGPSAGMHAHGHAAEDELASVRGGFPWVASRGRRGGSVSLFVAHSKRSAVLLLIATGSAMMPPALSSPSPGSSVITGRASICARGPCGGPVPPVTPTRLNLAVASATSPGPAAAQVCESSLRLRGGNADVSAAAEQAAPNGAKVSAKAKTYKQVASSRLEGQEVRNGGDVGQRVIMDKQGSEKSAVAGRNGDDGETKIVLQVDELKLEALRKLGQSLRMGGPGTARRKFKVVRKKAKVDDVKFQNAVRKLGFNPVGDIERVQVTFEDGTVWTYANPRLLANQKANEFCIQGRYEEQKPPPETEAQRAAREFDLLSDIEKLRSLAQASLPANEAAAVAADDVAAASTESTHTHAQAAAEGQPDISTGEAAAEGQTDVSTCEEADDKGSPEDILAAEED